MKSPRSNRILPCTPWKTWAECPATRVAPASRSNGPHRRTSGTGVGGRDEIRQPLRDLVSQIGEGDTGPVDAGGEILGMIAHSDDTEPKTVRVNDDGGPRSLYIRAGSHPGDPRSLEMAERVEERLLSEVEGVVVGQRDAVHSQHR